MTTPPEPQDRLSPIPLRERLAAELIKPFTAEDSREAGNYGSDQVFAGRVLAVFRDWLRDRAQQRQAEINEFPTDSYEPVKFPVEAASALRAEADAIDKELNQ